MATLPCVMRIPSDTHSRNSSPVPNNSNVTTEIITPSISPKQDVNKPQYTRTYSSCMETKPDTTLTDITQPHSTNTLLSITEANTLSKLIDLDNEKTKTNSLNLRNVIKKNKRESKSVLLDTYNILFGIKGNEACPTLNFNVIVDGLSDSLKCHIDTGTNYSFIKAQLVENRYLETDNLPNIVSANSQPINILGRTTLTMIISDNQYTAEFLVVENLALDIIIGNRFLLEHNMEISFKNKEIRIYNSTKNISDTIPMSMSWILKLGNKETISSIIDDSEKNSTTEGEQTRKYSLSQDSI